MLPRRLIAEDITLITQLDPHLGNVEIDSGQLEQIIMNLAINARDAMPRGGLLTIKTYHQAWSNWGHADGLQAAAQLPPGKYVVLTVRDTGFGMDEATCARIFEPFFTTKGPGKGTGLGLSTVFGIVRKSGGHISVYSQPEVGTTFRVYLPVFVGQTQTSERTIKPARSADSSGTILVVEDEASVREVLLRILERGGYKVLLSTKAEDALATAQAYTEPIHLLLSDLVLPGMNGPELAEQLARFHPESRLLIMSGYTDNVLAQNGIDSAFIHKPFTLNSLLMKVQEMLS